MSFFSLSVMDGLLGCDGREEVFNCLDCVQQFKPLTKRLSAGSIDSISTYSLRNTITRSLDPKLSSVLS